MIDTKKHWFIVQEKYLGHLFSKLSLTANQITILAGSFAIIGFINLLSSSLIWALVFYLIASLLDFVDGAVARTTKTVTKFGAYIDTIMDRYVEGSVFLGLMFLKLPTILLSGEAWAFLAMFGALVTTYAKAAAKEKELVNQELKGGLMSRGERLFLIFVALILGIIYPDFVYMTYVLALIAILANITAIQRVYSAIRLNK